MLPSLSSAKFTNGFVANTEAFCEFHKADIHFASQFTYFCNQFCRQFGRAMAFSVTWIFPSLLNHIGNIVGWSSNKQMTRINARWIITMMAHKLISRWFAVRQFPCHSMCKGSALVVSAKRKYSVLIVIQFSKPRPAFIMRFHFHVWPKTIWNWCKFNFSPTGIGTTQFGFKSFNVDSCVSKHNVGLCSHNPVGVNT